MTSDLIAVGVVTATHGTAGELRVRSFSGAPDSMLALREAVFRRAGSERLLRLRTVRRGPRGAIVAVEGLDTPEKARALVGSELWVPRAFAARLAPGEYYMADLCRCRLWLGNQEIGPVRSVWDGGPTALLEVVGRNGAAFYVPFTAHFVGEVDVDAGRIELKDGEIVR